MSLTVGLDVGGTKIAGALVEQNGAIRARRRRDSGKDVSFESALVQVVLELLAEAEAVVEAVGIAFAGMLDTDRSVVRLAPNLSLRDLPLKAYLAAHVHLPVVMENDADAAAWGEAAFGAGRDVDGFLMVTVGTGIGGGIVHNRRLFHGATGFAAEIGHVNMVRGGRPCGCGGQGCLEQYASGTALVRTTRERVAQGAPGSQALVDRVGGDVGAVTGSLITQAATEGDPFAAGQLCDLGRWLGEGIATVVAVLDPPLVIVGGGVSEAGDLLLDPLRQSLGEHLVGRRHRPDVNVQRAMLGSDAGLIGVAVLARQQELGISDKPRSLSLPGDCRV